jgi:hypothetical protein
MPHKMKNLSSLFFPIVALLSVVSCTSPRTAQSGGSYEDDEVYYQRGETFVTDAETPVAERAAPPTEEEDYYDPNSAGNGVTNNYYGDVYNNNGFNQGYGSPGNFGFQPRWIMTWSPYMGWYLTYNFGFNTCLGSNWNTWNDPFYYNNPWYMGNGWGNSMNYWSNPWCMNTGLGYWNPYGFAQNPYNYGWAGNNTPWWGGGWNGGDDPATPVIFGHRSPVSAASVFNSAYDGGRLFNQRNRQPLPPESSEITASGDMNVPVAGGAVRPADPVIPTRFPASIIGSDYGALPGERITRPSGNNGEGRWSDPSRGLDKPARESNSISPGNQGITIGRESQQNSGRGDSENRSGGGVRVPSGGGGSDMGGRSSGPARSSGGGGRTTTGRR